MDTRGAIIDSSGKVIKLRPFPNRDQSIDLGEGRLLVKLTDEQAASVRVGWVTKDAGATFSPR